MSTERMATILVRLTSISSALLDRQWRRASELSIQDGIEDVLKALCLTFEREARIGECRPDFLVDGIAIEAKVGGSLAALTRQVHRYVQLNSVRAVVVATTKRTHGLLPAQMNGKPVQCVVLPGSLG